jgi:uncharacterized protein YjbI with pentapeptide repeats
MQELDRLPFPNEGKKLTREEVWRLVAEARLHKQPADLRRADLSEINLIAADLREANLEEANLRGAHLEHALLLYACLRGAHLQGTSLRGTLLLGANLSQAHLQQADLRQALLYGANLMGANLSHADLTQANLRKANLQSACLERAVCAFASLHGACLRSADLRQANLSRAHLEGANLEEADLRKAVMKGAFLSATNTCGTLLSLRFFERLRQQMQALVHPCAAREENKGAHPLQQTSEMAPTPEKGNWCIWRRGGNMLTITATSRTDVGRARRNNEDAIAVCQPSNAWQDSHLGRLYLLCDGAGGHAAGEVASRLAGETMIHCLVLNEPARASR